MEVVKWMRCDTCQRSCIIGIGAAGHLPMDADRCPFSEMDPVHNLPGFIHPPVWREADGPFRVEVTTGIGAAMADGQRQTRRFVEEALSLGVDLESGSTQRPCPTVQSVSLPVTCDGNAFINFRDGYVTGRVLIDGQWKTGSFRIE